MSANANAKANANGSNSAITANGPVHPSLRGIKYVIFPDNHMAQKWDFVMILAIWFYAFNIPFQFGISGGYYTLFYTWWMIFSLCANFLFIVDTFVAFFRAYRDEHGRIVYCLKTIRRRYIRSGWFVINVLASLPATAFIYADARAHVVAGESIENSDVNYYFILEMFKLLRLVRIRKIMQTSEVMSRCWENINIEIALTLKFIFMITLVSHWIGCIWGFIAFMQAGSFGDPLLENLNWISNWYKTSYVEGGLDPIGWENAMQRYWLCMFWSIQSITSIGYGNIMPVTPVEFGFANLLMLFCGVFWAYIIGNLVEVVQSMGTGNREYLDRMNEANRMMDDFTLKDLPETVTGTFYAKSSKRVRRFITSQRDFETKSWIDSKNACSLASAYPTLNILSPELRQVCALHLTHSLLETIPYLSSKYLSPEEQSEVAFQCVTMEFSTAEKFVSHPTLGRGILIFRHGFALVSRKGSKDKFLWHKDLVNQPIDVDEVLVGDDYFREHQLAYHFLGFTKVFFVPRSVICGVLEKNERAWKECARWRYCFAALRLYSLNSQQSFEESHDCS